jgi:hypothetical protein
MAWARLDKKTKKPISIGITLTETALQGLPTDMEGPMPTMEFMLELPSVIKGLPFEYITLNWNPKGHIPLKIYDVPHFDMHFFTISDAERRSITLKGGNMAKAQKTPGKGFMAAGYILPPGTIEPMMGAHWVDPTSPELGGKPFTSTFIYGSYNGKVAFLEPMAALSFLESKPNFVQDLKVAQSFDKTGYYPTKYKVAYNEQRKEYTISLEDVVYKTATKSGMANTSVKATKAAKK